MVRSADGPYRPTPWEEAQNFWYWAEGKSELTAPQTQGITYTRPENAENKQARIDLSPELAWLNKRFWG